MASVGQCEVEVHMAWLAEDSFNGYPPVLSVSME